MVPHGSYRTVRVNPRNNDPQLALVGVDLYIAARDDGQIKGVCTVVVRTQRSLWHLLRVLDLLSGAFQAARSYSKWMSALHTPEPL